MPVVRVGEVRFEWKQTAEVNDCMNMAAVSVEDACHTVKGTLKICSYEQDDQVRWEWKADIVGSSQNPNGCDDGTFGVDLKSFVEGAMQMTAQYFRDVLSERQAETRAMLDKQARQRSRAERVSKAVSSVS